MNYGDHLSSAEMMGSREVALVVTYLKNNACRKSQGLKHLKTWSPKEPIKVGDHYEIHRDDVWNGVNKHFPREMAHRKPADIVDLILKADDYFREHFEEEDLY